MTTPSANTKKRHILVISSIPTVTLELLDLRSSLPPSVTISVADVKGSSDQLVRDIQSADILVGQPSLIADHWEYTRNKLQWLQIVFAGVDSVIPLLKVNGDFVFTRAGGDAFGPHLTEFAVGHILARERHFDFWKEQQARRKYRQENQYAYRTLNTLTVGIMGVSGQVGQSMASKCKAFGMTVKGLASRNASKQDNVDHIYATQTVNGVTTVPLEFLRDLDYLVSVLPATPQTIGLLNGDVLSQCSRLPANNTRPWPHEYDGVPRFLDADSSETRARTHLINLGRGSLIEDNSLIDALLGKNAKTLTANAKATDVMASDDAWLDGATLDVFNQEPLQQDNPLYRISDKTLTIAPHCSGMSFSSAPAIVQVFKNNLERFLRGAVDEMEYRYDEKHGY